MPFQQTETEANDVVVIDLTWSLDKVVGRKWRKSVKSEFSEPVFIDVTENKRQASGNDQQPNHREDDRVNGENLVVREIEDRYGGEGNDDYRSKST